MRVGRLVLVAGVVTMAIACGAHLRLPSQGGDTWTEVTSEHFTLWTDGPATTGRDIVRQMEHRRQVILTAMQRAGSPTRLFVVALRNQLELDDVLPAKHASSTWGADNPTGQPGLVLAVENSDRSPLVARQLARVFSHELFTYQPNWLDEGVGAYFELSGTSSPVGASGRLDIQTGWPCAWIRQFLDNSAPLPSADLFAATSDEAERIRFHASSWALFSFLVMDHEAALDRYRQRLTELWEEHATSPWYEQFGAAGDTEANLRRPHVRQQRWRALQDLAWREAFPGYTPDKLDDELRSWLNRGRLPIASIQLALDDVAMTERALGEADVLAARSFLALMYKDDLAAVRRDAASALALDPTHVLARLLHAALAHTISRADAAATAAAHPDDWRAQRLVELAFQGSPEASAAHDRICALSQRAAPECARGAGVVH